MPLKAAEAANAANTRAYNAARITLHVIKHLALMPEDAVIRLGSVFA